MLESFLTKSDSKALVSKLTKKTYAAHEVIYDHENNDIIYIVLDGLVGVYKNPNGMSRLNLIYFEGDILPVALLYGESQHAKAIAETDAEVGFMQIDNFMDFFRANPRRMEALLRQVAHQHTVYSNRVSGLVLQFGRDRLIYRLIFLVDRLNPGTKTKDLAIPRIARTSMAQSANLSKEKVSREMARLIKLGIVRYEPKRIIITDLTKLKNQLGKNIELPNI